MIVKVDKENLFISVEQENYRFITKTMRRMKMMINDDSNLTQLNAGKI